MGAEQEIGKSGGGSIPTVFEDGAYRTLSTIVLSTSTLGSPALESGGFGPVCDECYGIGYSISNDDMRFTIMSYKHRDGQRFTDCLESCLRDMVRALKLESENNQ